jgi:hypothetical protein
LFQLSTFWNGQTHQLNRIKKAENTFDSEMKGSNLPYHDFG